MDSKKMVHKTIKYEDLPTKVRENFIRRSAHRVGLILKKSRAKKWNIDNKGGYMLVTFENTIFAGEKFDLDLGQVEALITEYEKKLSTDAKGWMTFKKYQRK